MPGERLTIGRSSFRSVLSGFRLVLCSFRPVLSGFRLVLCSFRLGLGSFRSVLSGRFAGPCGQFGP
ncbi:MAG: hypothetical protein HOW71_36050, partial [Nonomuraea sp.]|nr:hypothetical protein [Nonomuraea sp.]